MQRIAPLLLLAFSLCPAAFAEEGFEPLTDGASFDGWKPATENSDTWKLEEGAFVTRGPRSHLFYVGNDKPFRDFELKVEVMTEANANGGIYFHTEYQAEGWPGKGYETQVNNTHSDWRKTGSLYGIQDVRESPAADGRWWTQHIIVQGNHITVKIDGTTVVDYTEPENPEAGAASGRRLDQGTFALQAHDPGSVVHYRNIRVKRLD